MAAGIVSGGVCKKITLEMIESGEAEDILKGVLQKVFWVIPLSHRQN
ncbi:hypothetical protein [Paenibacillus terrae]|nr:hypothetical protein [Paenibacillus terrae]